LEPISSHAEHAQKCLKVEYLGRIEYDFQKSRVTGPWDHMVSVSAKKVYKKFHACVPLTSRLSLMIGKGTNGAVLKRRHYVEGLFKSYFFCAGAQTAKILS
jgi:hypothetical protein